MPAQQAHARRPRPDTRQRRRQAEADPRQVDEGRRERRRARHREPELRRLRLAHAHGPDDELGDREPDQAGRGPRQGGRPPAQRVREGHRCRAQVGDGGQGRQGGCGQEGKRTTCDAHTGDPGVQGKEGAAAACHDDGAGAGGSGGAAVPELGAFECECDELPPEPGRGSVQSDTDAVAVSYFSAGQARGRCILLVVWS